MTESRKRRPRTKLVFNAVDDLMTEPAALAKPESKDVTATVAFVVPSVKKMLNTVKRIVAVELDEMARTGKMGDTSGQKIRNLAATISSVQDSEKKATEGPSGLEGASPAEFAAALRAEADRVEGKGLPDDE